MQDHTIETRDNTPCKPPQAQPALFQLSYGVRAEPSISAANKEDPMPDLHYFTGFGNEFATEAVPGALPIGQNAPQTPPLGLYTEQLSGSPFTASRLLNRRPWPYPIRPSFMHNTH